MLKSALLLYLDLVCVRNIERAQTLHGDAEGKQNNCLCLGVLSALWDAQDEDLRFEQRMQHLTNN